MGRFYSGPTEIVRLGECFKIVPTLNRPGHLDQSYLSGGQMVPPRLVLLKCEQTMKSLFTEFFTFFVIFLNLCINTRLARLYIILMAFAFYCVGCAKAFLCLPRPRLPLVKPLESALDWALPSNHAVMATCLPLYVWFYSYLHQAQLGLTSGMFKNIHQGFTDGLHGRPTDRSRWMIFEPE